MIEGVVGVIIWTESLDRLLSFYRDTLGLEPHSLTPDFASFKWGGVRLGIGRHSEIEGVTTEPHRVMVNLGVDDIQREYDALRSRGVRFTRRPELEHWGGWVSTFSDPDGNTLQLMQLPEQDK